MEEETRLLEGLECQNDNESRESRDSSEDSDNCLICFHVFEKDSVYAIINSENEKFKKYHPECLDQWFQKKPTGLITNKPVKTYTIFQNDNIIEEVEIPNNQIDNSNENYFEEQTDVEAQVQIDTTTSSSSSSQSNCTESKVLKGFIFFCIILVIVVLAIILFI